MPIAIELLIPIAEAVSGGQGMQVMHDQIFRDCMTNFCAMIHIFLNLMGNGTNLE